jgi:catechol 2,3-dioxygenase-like lactoylglutathione lyase family enzyme
MSIPFHSLVPLIHVGSVPKSIAFYERLGFEVPYSYKAENETELSWAFLKCGGASLMLARATQAVVAAQQRVEFALYVNDVDAKHGELVAAGVKAGPVEHPFFRPRGQFRVEDPDGYVILVQSPERS